MSARHLKDSIKNYAYELGADLVGFGGIDRCKHAPIMMSPQGVFPGSKTVIVMGIHHPDACIELGGEKHPQEIGPYVMQHLMNLRLDEMAYRMATFLEKSGCGAIPIAASNIWRYNQYKSLTAIFAPDVSHIYMAVVAGLADMGYSGLALTPEYGARNRFVTVITDEEIESDPLIPPGTVCDHCMLCRKHCPTQALSKEIDGEKTLKIDGYEYRFANKNIWRCSWGEHFTLDLDLKIPEVVTEQVIRSEIKAHGFRSAEMGQCLKFCVPKRIRRFNPSYSKTPMRTHWITCNESIESRAVADRLLARICGRGADEVIVTDAEKLRPAGVDLGAILPGAKSAVTVLMTCPTYSNDNAFRSGAQYHVNSICYDLTRSLDELGFRSVMTIARSGSHPDGTIDYNPTDKILATLPGHNGRKAIANTVVTCKTLAAQQRVNHGGGLRLDHGNAAADLTRHMADLARQLGADLVGVASTTRMEQLAGQLRPVFEEMELLDAKDRAPRCLPWMPEITKRKRQVKTPSDHLPGAKSALVFGLRMHKEVLRWATRPPAEAVGPYSFQTYATNHLGSLIGCLLIKRLEEFGYRGVMTMDLTGTDSFTASKHGPQPDLFSNRFAGLAAGLGYLTISGHLATPEFGIRQRCIAIVTDAPLTPSPLCARDRQNTRCAACDRPCMTTCPSQAITSRSISLECEGRTYDFNLIDGKRCDWVKRYALMGDSGFKYLGSTVDVPPPEPITDSALAEALCQHDPINKHSPVVAEHCVINCPLSLKTNMD